MIELFLAGALLLSSPQTPAPPVSQDPLQLEDVVVSGRTLDSLIEDFVGEVAEPNRNRGLARWHDSICVGVANLDGEIAQYLSDRISTVATDMGLRAGAPGCTPNILVIATADAGGLARQLTEERRRAFRMGGAGMDRGGSALRDFVEADRPVRWWQMSMPVDSETGDPAVRIPGRCTGDCIDAADMAPQIYIHSASRLSTQIVDNLIRTIVIVDVDEVGGLSALQLADYIAMVSLAQIDPDADTSNYASILNVFEAPEISDSLTDWDKAYLDGLYAAERNHVGERADRSEIADSIRRSHDRLREEEVAEEPVAD
ncbi:MAG: hypothetical protein M3Q74_08520 [Pseudomonadota bacterium]|nr:hypothetical protein [Pseudomonadota bacterium]